MYYTYIAHNIRDKKSIRTRLGKKTVGENVRESLWNFAKKILRK